MLAQQDSILPTYILDPLVRHVTLIVQLAIVVLNVPPANLGCIYMELTVSHVPSTVKIVIPQHV